MNKDGSGRRKEPLAASQNDLAVREKMDTMDEPYRTMAFRLHEIIMATAPELKPRLWYGMPGYAKAVNAPVLLFFRADEIYMTFGLTEKVKFHLEEGASHELMPCAWFFTDLSKASEEKIAEIVLKAIR